MLSSLLLGLIQGLTEFLPVSSSGHLVLLHSLIGYQVLDPAFDVFIQGGTIISLLIYYARRLSKLDLSRSYLVKLLLGIAPSGIIGILLRHDINNLFANTSLLTLGFLATSFLLILTHNRAPRGELTYSKAFLIGLFQVASILPSLSRSGATISSALILGVSPAVAFDFSFLMSIPLVLGASLLSLPSLNLAPPQLPLYFIGLITASLVGYLTLVILGQVVKQGKLYLFAPYTLLLALVSYLFI